MHAACNRAELPAPDGPPARLDETTPRPVFTAAYGELCTRIWTELELLLAQLESRPAQDLDMRMPILRLELVVLMDCVRSTSWRSMLSAEQRDSLYSMLSDVLAALYVDSEHLRAGIESAQDRVLYELRPESWTEAPLISNHKHIPSSPMNPNTPVGTLTI
ncbi:MAG TPA: hypothetical protein VGM84_09940 [Steroidobacteraceae bacterium]